MKRFTFSIWALAGLALLTTPTAGRAQCFGPVMAYTTGGIPAEVAVADVDGDGRPDAVTANYSNGTLSVLPGLGNGQFGPATTVAAGVAEPLSVAVADLNADGRPDLVCGDRATSRVAVLLALSTGFEAPVLYATGGSGAQVGQVQVADLDQDGRPDLVAVNANATTGGVAVLRGLGAGRFAPGQTYGTQQSIYPVALAVGDVTGDGRPDLVLADNYNHNVVLLPALATGGFGPGVGYASGGQFPSGVALADLTGDGLLDAVVTNRISGSVGVLAGVAGGSFAPATVYATGQGGSLEGVAVGDVDGDGQPDLLVQHLMSHRVGVLPGTAGGFGPATWYSAGPGSSPWRAVLADLNGDQRPDVVAADFGSSHVGAWLNQVPTLRTLSPGPAAPGTPLTLTGVDLAGTTAIRFSGPGQPTTTTGFVVNAAGTAISNIIVPAGATSGPVSVLTATGPSNSLPFVLLTPTAARPLVAAVAPALYPNPAHDRATLTLPASALPAVAGLPATVQLLDALGRVVQTTAAVPTAHEVMLDVTGLPAGLYAVRLTRGGAVLTQRLVVE